MLYKIEITQSEPICTAVVHGIVRLEELPQFVPSACGEVWNFIRAANLPKPGRHVALYLDKGAVEVGAEVAEAFVGNERVHCAQLPTGRVATTTHFGPYQGLGEAHKAIQTWCAENGQSPTGVSWEIYGHWEEDWNSDSSKIRTDVFYLLDDAKN